MDAIFLHLIGQPLIRAGGDEYPLASERRHQLLAYLACRDGWVPRAEIARLFWEGHDDARARRNLRRLLHEIRRIPWAAGLESEGGALRWRVPSDLAGFAAACGRGDWDESIRAGAGTLLAGMEKDAPDPFHDWLRCERQAHVTRWRESLARRREALRGESGPRMELARFALAHDPCNEAALADLVDALRARGRDAEAREAYRAFAARVREELGVEPALALAEPPRPNPAAGVAQPVASPGPGLIGRRLEQAQLVETLRRADCRRATLVGPEGAGKSTLVAAARGRLAADFPDGVCWAGLRELSQPARIPARISEACGFGDATALDPVSDLAQRIGARRMLIVLDNCEHLAGVGAIGAVLVGRCPNLKILHVSRTRVGCAGERVVELAGLAVPDADETEPEILANFDAVRLFEARARQVDPSFDAMRCIDDVAALVRLVEGLPLAIEAAAARTRYRPLAQVMAQLVPAGAQRLQNPASQPPSRARIPIHSATMMAAAA